jgi:putative inorganic carbon (hco3(-)) transporter
LDFYSSKYYFTKPLMPAPKNDIGTIMIQWLHREVMLKKCMSPLGITILSLLAIVCGYLAYIDLFFIPIAVASILAGLIVTYYCLFKPLTGFYIVTSIAFLAFYPSRLLNKEIPLSSGVEILTLFLFLGTFLSKRKKPAPQTPLVRTGISVLLIIYTLYYIVALFNPNMDNMGGWAFSFKRYLVYILIYIIAYKLIDSPDKLRYFLKFWILFSFVAALYGCYQQWFGLLPMELNYIKSDPIEFKLLNQGGTIRKFSFLSDVVSFGILSGSMSVLTIILAINDKNKKRRNTLYAISIILILGMLYSGTRTTTIILPAGIGLYIFMTIQNKTTLATLFASFMVAFFVLFAPINTPVLNRIRSTFNSKEESLQVRDINRHYIQPYIYAHPIGGGIATTGVEGKRFNPGHPLAGFPPDSGLLKAALELGWVGLALTMLFYLSILYQGIHYYFSIRNKTYKVYIVAITTSLFATIVTQYAQVSIGQIPGAIFFFAALSLLKKIREFDEAEQVGNKTLIINS